MSRVVPSSRRGSRAGRYRRSRRGPERRRSRLPTSGAAREVRHPRVGRQAARPGPASRAHRLPEPPARPGARGPPGRPRAPPPPRRPVSERPRSRNRPRPAARAIPSADHPAAEAGCGGTLRCPTRQRIPGRVCLHCGTPRSTRPTGGPNTPSGPPWSPARSAGAIALTAARIPNRCSPASCEPLTNASTSPLILSLLRSRRPAVPEALQPLPP